jgi:hypothetical protein
MTTMQCYEFEQILEQGVAEQLPADAAAHLNECGRCHAMVSDLEAIEAAARQLGAEEVEPPERVWLSLRAQLESEGLLRTPQKVGWSVGWGGGWLAALPRPALAVAYLSLLLAAAVLFGVRGNLQQNLATQSSQAKPVTASLDTQLTNVARKVSAMHQHDPDVTASLRQNLNIVDNSIALCEKSVREEPQNELAREYLYGAYQQKAEVLAMMMDRSASGE